ncbi:MAG: ribonuclease R [Patescibacteria group bacterium]
MKTHRGKPHHGDRPHKQHTKGGSSHSHGEKAGEYETTIRITGKGTGYVDIEGKEESIFIEREFLNTALHRDRVTVSMYARRVRGQETGEVTSIVFRAKKQFVGIVRKENGALFLEPDDHRVYADILISDTGGHAITEGEKICVEMTKWDDPKMNPVGKVIVVLGQKGDNEVEMHAIALEKGVALAFPPDVLKEADGIPVEIPEEEIKRRRDMREVTTFTIDPIDAKDFDDALSYRVLPNGDHEVGIHIADVTHYVRPGSALDREAQERATSVYLVDRTIPMLPERLSNDLCSLNEGEDKLTFAAVFVISEKDIANGKVTLVSEWFGRTVIHSNKRFTYENAQAILDARDASNRPTDQKGRFRDVLDGKKDGPFGNELRALSRVALVIRKERFASGAISFEKDEVKFQLDEKGKPLGVYIKKRQETNKMIEDFMLLANKHVAEWIGKRDPRMESAFVYRVHDVPDKDRILELATFLKTLGYKLQLGPRGPRSQDINTLLESVKGTPEENMIHTAAIRSMAKAVYATKNIGHYGLSFTHYTHFTSPIRRYPDMMVHRLVASYLSNIKLSKEAIAQYEVTSRYSSEREGTAAEAERDSIKYKQVEFMQSKVGQEFDAVISGVTDWGMYVELSETKAEGLVPIRTLGDDYYTLDEKTYSIRGQRTKKVFRLGDDLRVRLARADLDRRQLDFEVVK